MNTSPVMKCTLVLLMVLWLGAFLEKVAGEESVVDDSGLRIQFHFTYGPLGPRRPPEFIAGEMILASLQIAGLSTSGDDNGASFSTQITVKDEANQVVGRLPLFEFDERLTLGGNSFSHAVILPVPMDPPAGKYFLEIIVTDRLNNKTTQHNTSFILNPGDTFGAPVLYLSKDKEGQIVHAAVLAIGEAAYLRCVVTGMEARDGKAKMTTSIDVSDEKQRPIGKVPYQTGNHTPFHTSNSRDGYRFAYPVLINRPGKFTLRLKVKDEHSGKEFSHSLPIVVIDPQLELTN